MRHGINKGFCQSVPQVTLNNFTPHKYFVKFKSSCPKRRLCGKISETEQNYITNDVIDKNKTYYHKNILPIFSSGYAEQLNFL